VLPVIPFIQLKLELKVSAANNVESKMKYRKSVKVKYTRSLTKLL